MRKQKRLRWEKLQTWGIRKTERKRLVIVGGGFAGLHLIRNLQKSDIQVVLIDKRNHHTFQPLLYQVATSGLEADAVAYPLRKPLRRHPDYHFRMAEVKLIKAGDNVIVTNRGALAYDYLVIATGARTNYFGIESIQKHALPMKSVDEALKIRNRILQNFEDALLTHDPHERQKLTNVVIAGGGPTGVELAGSIAEFRRYIMPKDYADLDTERSRIYLIELLPELLASMSDEASAKSELYLQQLGVNIKKETKILSYNGEIVETDGENIPAKTMIWTGGVSGAFPEGINDELITKKGRIKADTTGKVKGYERIFALGDVASIETDEYPNGYPQLASVAVQQGKFMAENIIRMSKGKPLKPFKYKNNGTMATIGRKKAVVDLPGLKFQGAAAWLVWLGVHLFSLVGFKNRLVTFINWAWSYIRYDRETRLIIKD
ncbi:NAD(P)/FAD-dependent oxidoreductase [Fulvivirga ulvae]|uniref:NAD(P)/FAD-dependent oxidoreductase n=1 Tax=Fulvivirga ulvae TaxID=2904245 RepID=UPI001F2ADF28|nr:NAD(P)/FAD-dependent oxidoreductase [Fulvivirga ulvae]UII31400.1 NAD(P)/FAD-dependent oxidoreductase [Fulvivirga ulvae]